MIIQLEYILMSTNWSSTNNTINFQNSACRVVFVQVAFSCKSYVDFARTLMPLGLQKTLDVCSISRYEA